MSKLGVRTVVRQAPSPPPLSPPSQGGEKGGDGDVLLCAFNDLRDRLISTLAFILGNREDAQDAAQDAFLKCWRARDGLPAVTDLPAWIFRVALNTARDLQRGAWRRRVRPMRGEIMLTATDAPPLQTLEHQESLDRLRRAILDLRPDEKEVFLLRQNGDLTYEQIAELRKAPVGTVKTQMRSALQKLRQVLLETSA